MITCALQNAINGIFNTKMNFTHLSHDGVTLRCNVDREFSTAILAAFIR